MTDGEKEIKESIKEFLASSEKNTVDYEEFLKNIRANFCIGFGASLHSKTVSEDFSVEEVACFMRDVFTDFEIDITSMSPSQFFLARKKGKPSNLVWSGAYDVYNYSRQEDHFLIIADYMDGELLSYAKHKKFDHINKLEDYKFYLCPLIFIDGFNCSYSESIIYDLVKNVESCKLTSKIMEGTFTIGSGDRKDFGVSISNKILIERYFQMMTHRNIQDENDIRNIRQYFYQTGFDIETARLIISAKYSLEQEYCIAPPNDLKRNLFFSEKK